MVKVKVVTPELIATLTSRRDLNYPSTRECEEAALATRKSAEPLKAVISLLRKNAAQQQERLAAACPECEVGGRGALCAQLIWLRRFPGSPQR